MPRFDALGSAVLLHERERELAAAVERERERLLAIAERLVAQGVKGFV